MTGKVANLSNYPNGFSGGLVLEGIPTLREHSGKVFYVGDTNSAAFPNRKGASDINKGGFMDPFLTLDHAVEQCTAKRGDVVRILPGTILDIETSVPLDVEGMAVVGMGFGDDRAQITPDVLNALDVEADNVTLANLYFNEKTGATTTSVDVVGSNVVLAGCHFDLGANDAEVVTLTAGADGFKAVGNEFVVTANGTDDVFDIEGVVDRAKFLNNVFVDSAAPFDSAAIEAAANAITNTYLEGNRVIGGGSLLAATADVGTVNYDASGNASLEMKAFTATEVDSETAAAVASVESGTVAIWGMLGVTSNSNGATSKYGFSTEAAGPQGALTLGTAADEDLSAAGDVFVYGTTPGGTQTVTEVAGNMPNGFWKSPLIVQGDTEIDVAPEVAAEGVYDLTIYYTPLTNGAVIAAAE